MKKAIWAMIVMILSLSGFAQTSDSSLIIKKQALLLKSKNQKTASWIFGGIGVVAIPIGMAVLSKATLEEGFGETEGGKGGATALLIVGTISLGTGAILAMESKKNKNEAMKITATIGWEKTAPLVTNHNLPLHYPALSVKMQIR